MSSSLQPTNNTDVDVFDRVYEKMFELLGVYKKVPSVHIRADHSNWFMINYPDVFPLSLLTKAFKQATLRTAMSAIKAGHEQRLCDWICLADWPQEQ